MKGVLEQTKKAPRGRIFSLPNIDKADVNTDTESADIPFEIITSGKNKVRRIDKAVIR